MRLIGSDERFRAVVPLDVDRAAPRERDEPEVLVGSGTRVETEVRSARWAARVVGRCSRGTILDGGILDRVLDPWRDF